MTTMCWTTRTRTTIWTRHRPMELDLPAFVGAKPFDMADRPADKGPIITRRHSFLQVE